MFSKSAWWIVCGLLDSTKIKMANVYGLIGNGCAGGVYLVGELQVNDLWIFGKSFVDGCWLVV
jgi:hypothetical protein